MKQTKTRSTRRCPRHGRGDDRPCTATNRARDRRAEPASLSWSRWPGSPRAVTRSRSESRHSIANCERSTVETGIIDVAMHRDDVGTRPELPVVRASNLPQPLEDRTVIIIDDVLYTGRTVRAAMDAIDSFGRPARIQLAVLIDRGHRELPIRPDYVGKNLPTATQERVRVRLAAPTTRPTGYGWRGNHAQTRVTGKDLLGLRELSADEITLVLILRTHSRRWEPARSRKVPALHGKTLVNFFVEPSTRTRTSFELAAFRLSADVINMSATTSSLTKGETLKDTARNLEALHADILVLRHSSAGAPQFLASRLKASVINAGDGAHEHPTQALLDLCTIRERERKNRGHSRRDHRRHSVQSRRALEHLRPAQARRARHAGLGPVLLFRASLKNWASKFHTRSMTCSRKPTS